MFEDKTFNLHPGDTKIHKTKNGSSKRWRASFKPERILTHILLVLMKEELMESKEFLDYLSQPLLKKDSTIHFLKRSSHLPYTSKGVSKRIKRSIKTQRKISFSVSSQLQSKETSRSTQILFLLWQVLQFLILGFRNTTYSTVKLAMKQASLTIIWSTNTNLANKQFTVCQEKTTFIVQCISIFWC